MNLWNKYVDRDTIGYARLISDDFKTYADNAEVILLDAFSDGTRLLTRIAK